ncbi:MAG: branched-chain amino acid ABC transporter permease [Rubrivivax sp.]
MEFVQVVVNGVLTGLVYGILALSFVVIYRASKIVNLAQGQLVMLSGVFVSLFAVRMGLSLWQALPLAVAASALLGLAIERTVFRRLIGQPAFTTVMASIGVLIFLQAATQVFFGPQDKPFPRIFPEGAWTLGPLQVSKTLAIGAAITLVVTEAMHRFFTRTRPGLRLAAVAEDHTIALSLGVSVREATTVAWIAGTLLALLAACILLSGASVGLHVSEVGLRLLPVAILGGLESVRGSALAGLILGVGEALASRYLDEWTNGAASLVFPYLLMIVVLLVRPHGLFGWRTTERL